MITTDLPLTTPDIVDGIATQFVASVLTPQTVFEEEDRDFLFRCCFNLLALAGGTEAYQNDVSGFLFRKELAADTIVMTLQEDIGGVMTDLAVISDNTYGTFYDFGDLTTVNNPTSAFMTGVLIAWANVKTLHGENKYRLKIERDIMGTPDTLFTLIYDVRTYSPALADNTIRIDWTQNGEILNDLDYTDLNWQNSLRLCGFFGNRQEDKEETLFKNSKYQTSQVRSEITWTYDLEIGMVPQCIMDDIDNLKQADILQISDFNKRNFDYSLNEIGVKIAEIGETTYKERLAKLTMTLEESEQNRIKFNC